MTAKKTNTRTKKGATTEVAVKEEHAVGLPFDYGEHTGGGFRQEDTGQDLAIPFLNLLQAKSPEVEDPEHEAYIEGAKSGMFINSLTKELYQDVLLIPVVKQSAVVEWIPRTKGGGWVASHAPDSDVVRNSVPNSDPNKKRVRQTQDGNDLVDTTYLYCLVVNSLEDTEPAGTVVLSLTSTKLAPWRAINTQMRMVKGNPPRYAFVIRAKSKTETKNGNTWKNCIFEFANGAPVNSLIDPKGPLFAAAVALRDSIESGSARADFAASNDQHQAGGASAGTDADIF